MYVNFKVFLYDYKNYFMDFGGREIGFWSVFGCPEAVYCT